jgi:hypothetical protein
MATVPSIVDVYPANGALGIPIGDQITVTFDQEMDEDSINTGTFVLTGPDQGIFFGGEMNPFEAPGLTREDILDSPYFGGFVQCTVSFSRVDASGSPVSDSAVDYTGDGTLWRTVAILTPQAHLSPNKEYTALVAGDEDPTNAFDSGVRTRTVFDPEPVTVTGTGLIYAGGGFTGAIQKTYHVRITTGGQTGNATYQWWEAADPFTLYNGITTTGQRELELGVYITCDPDGTFVVGDNWTIVCKPFYALLNTYKWTFSTGSGSIITPPSTSSASGIEQLGTSSSGSTSTSAFSVLSVDPEGGEYGVEISTDSYIGERIEFTFTDTNPADPATFVDAVSVRSEPAVGIDDSLSITYLGDLSFTTSLVGSNVLRIDLDPGQLYQNNIVIVTLDENIADDEGNTLGEEYITYFSTTYSPIYTSLRRIRLDLGALISSVQDETIMLAILEASLAADAISFVANTENTQFYNFARREYVTCLAELTLVNALASDASSSDKMTKRLGDLSVSRGGVGAGLSDTKDKLINCVEYWKVVIQSGGEISPDTSLKPESSVKGSTAEDAIVVGRQWEATSGLGYYRPSINTSVRGSSSRRALKTWRTRNSWRTGD